MHSLSPSPKNKKKSNPEQNSLYCRKWDFLTVRLNHSYISRNGTSRKLGILQFRECKPRKNFSNFLKRNGNISENGNFKTPSHVSGNRNSLYFAKRHIENPDICRTLVYLEPKVYSEHYQKSTMERFSKMATRSTFLHSRK